MVQLKLKRTFRNLHELLLCRRIVSVLVWMVLQGQFVKRLLNLLVSGGTVNTKNFVVIIIGTRTNDKMETATEQQRQICRQLHFCSTEQQ